MRLSDFYRLDPSKKVRCSVSGGVYPDGVAPLVGTEIDVAAATADYDIAIHYHGHLHMVEGWKQGGASADAGDTVDLIRIRGGSSDTICTLACNVADGAIIVPGSWDDSHADLQEGDILRASANNSTDVECTIHVSFRLA